MASSDVASSEVIYRDENAPSEMILKYFVFYAGRLARLPEQPCAAERGVVATAGGGW